MSTAKTSYRLGAQAVTTIIHVSRSNACVFLKIPYNPFTLANIYYAVRTNSKPHKVDNLIHSTLFCKNLSVKTISYNIKVNPITQA